MATLVAIGGPAALGAQQPAKSCPDTVALIIVKVVDAKGTPVTDAKIDVKRERDGKDVPGTMTDMSATGEYVVMDDMALPFVPVAGTRFVVRATRGKQATSSVFRIGRTADGCHVRRLSDDVKLVLGR